MWALGKFLLPLAACAALLSQAPAQQREALPPPRAVRPRTAPPRPAVQARVRARQNLVDHLMSLSPEEQQRFMRTNPQFRSLPPLQQQRIQQRLQQFNSLPPQRQQALRERYELFRQLPPEQQDRARALYRQWMRYPPDRRQELLQGFRRLRDASPGNGRSSCKATSFTTGSAKASRRLLRAWPNCFPAVRSYFPLFGNGRVELDPLLQRQCVERQALVPERKLKAQLACSARERLQRNPHFEHPTKTRFHQLRVAGLGAGAVVRSREFLDLNPPVA